MTSGNTKTHRSRSKPRTTPLLDVMVARGTGRVRTFRISPRILLLGMIFFILYIPISVLVINDYLIGREEQEAQRNQVSRLRTELDDARKMIFRYQQQVAMLREHIETEKAESVPSIKEMARAGEPLLPTDQGSGEDPSTSEKSWKTIPPPEADIKDLTVYREGQKLRITFKIVNLKDVGTLEGYVFVVAIDPAGSPQGLWSYPQAVLVQEGIPDDYRNGFRFIIRNFKTITMAHGLGPESDLPPVLRILVYDRSGTLLRKEDMEVKPEG